MSHVFHTTTQGQARLCRNLISNLLFSLGLFIGVLLFWGFRTRGFLMRFFIWLGSANLKLNPVSSRRKGTQSPLSGRICMFVYLYIYTYKYTLYIYTCIYIYMIVCVSTCTHTYTQIHVYIYIHINVKPNLLDTAFAAEVRPRHLAWSLLPPAAISSLSSQHSCKFKALEYIPGLPTARSPGIVLKSYYSIKGFWKPWDLHVFVCLSFCQAI